MSVDCAAPSVVGKGKLTLEEFNSEIEGRLEGYEIELEYTLEEVREEYEIVDEEGNSIEHKIDWDRFGSYASVEVSYEGDLLTPAERVIKGYEGRVSDFKERVNEFWELIKSGKCTNRGNTEVEHINQTDWNGFGRQLHLILRSNQYLENSRKNALKNIEALDTSEQEKEALANQIEELYASVEPFIKKGEE